MKGAINRYSGTLNNGTETDLVTITGKGYLKELLVEVDSTTDNEVRDVEIVFYVDAEGTASTRVKHGYLFGWIFTAKEFITNALSCILYDTTNHKFVGTKDIRIPFGTSVKISLKNTSYSAGANYDLTLSYILE